MEETHVANTPPMRDTNKWPEFYKLHFADLLPNIWTTNYIKTAYLNFITELHCITYKIITYNP